MGEIIQTCHAKTGDHVLIPRFWWNVFTHSLPDIITKHDIKENFGEHNIWVHFIHMMVSVRVAVK